MTFKAIKGLIYFLHAVEKDSSFVQIKYSLEAMQLKWYLQAAQLYLSSEQTSESL